jgi:magnesium transporter
MPTTIVTTDRVTWTDITQPTQVDMDALSARYPQFHPLNLRDCLNELEIPKLDHDDNHLFIVVQMPLWSEAEQIYTRTEVDVFITKGVLVTSHPGVVPSLIQLSTNLQKDGSQRNDLMGKGASPFLYELLHGLIDECYPIVFKVGHSLHHIEKRLFHNDTRHLLYEIARLRRDIITLRSILKPQIGVIQLLAHGDWPFIHEELDPYWDNLSDHLVQLSTMLDEYYEIIVGLSDTVDTLASHRIDEVVHLLTVVTVITLPVSLLAAIFGMNVVVPWGEHPLMFYGLIFFSLLLTAWLGWYLRRKQWL